MEPSQEIFDAVRAGDTGRLQASDTVKLLLARGADSKDAAALAATKGRLEVLKLLKGQA